MKTKKRKSGLSKKSLNVLKKDQLMKIKGGTEEGTVGGTQKDGEFD